MNKFLDNQIGLIDRKFIINIKNEGSFASYSKVAHRLLTEERAPQIQLSACGAATLYLFKVSSILTEFFPNLHRLTYFNFSICHTCKQRELKIAARNLKNQGEDQTQDNNLLQNEYRLEALDLKAKDQANQEKIKMIVEFADKINVNNLNFAEIRDSDQNTKQSPTSLQHQCNDPNSFSLLITMNQRLTFHDGILDKQHPGYQKPNIPLKSKKSLIDLINEFNPNETLDKVDYDYSDRSNHSSSYKSPQNFEKFQSSPSQNYQRPKENSPIQYYQQFYPQNQINSIKSKTDQNQDCRICCQTPPVPQIQNCCSNYTSCQIYDEQRYSQYHYSPNAAPQQRFPCNEGSHNFQNSGFQEQEYKSSKTYQQTPSFCSQGYLNQGYQQKPQFKQSRFDQKNSLQLKPSFTKKFVDYSSQYQLFPMKSVDSQKSNIYSTPEHQRFYNSSQNHQIDFHPYSRNINFKYQGQNKSDEFKAQAEGYRSTRDWQPRSYI
ncbi:UNKNOWN [Stylonychia lemnae]|uniref:Uncharacterized protein n=1 Tax=Stylonychia lemnae TaxID=5949 RepID=A0A078ANG1_STYLE|nr:UNKNOWN [Stylonychia lemnae]|eukprot:CDW82498.1 UNKNOWN [Stylonychia lemnae]